MAGIVDVVLTVVFVVVALAFAGAAIVGPITDEEASLGDKIGGCVVAALVSGACVFAILYVNR